MKLLRILILSLTTCAFCTGQSAREIARTAFKSVFLLELDDAQGQPLSLGTGFTIADGIIATNAHVIAGASGGTAKLVGDDRKVQILGAVAVDYHCDLALLKVSSPAPALGLGLRANPVVGDKVYVVGNPLGLEGTFSEGIISGVRSIGADTILQMTAPISPGSSGGPVMDDSGAVIGVAEATFKDGQNLNLAVPVKYLSSLWASASQSLQVTSLSQQLAPDSGRAVVDGVGTRIEAGVATSDFHLEKSPFDSWGFELRIINKLPVSVSQVKLRIIYYDAANAIMDFEDFSYPGIIPPAMTKTVPLDSSNEATRAVAYYNRHGVNGIDLPEPSYANTYNAMVDKMKPKIEVRVIGFSTDGSE